jgi:hypothetical protein
MLIISFIFLVVESYIRNTIIERRRQQCFFFCNLISKFTCSHKYYFDCSLSLIFELCHISNGFMSYRYTVIVLCIPWTVSGHMLSASTAASGKNWLKLQNFARVFVRFHFRMSAGTLTYLGYPRFLSVHPH